MIWVPIMSQRLVAKQSMYKKETNEFNERMKKANSEGDHNLIYQIVKEQREFYKSKGIKMFNQFSILLVNGAVFFTQFSAIKKMANTSYPGFTNEGALWFTDLTTCDPYYVLPLLSSATLAFVMRVFFII